MSREGKFMVHCVECYRLNRHLSGSEVAELFSRYGVFEYIIRYFESLHVNGEQYIVEELDEFIAKQKAA